jgi:hypothetical protein
MTSFALPIGQPANRKKIGSLEQPNAILERQTLARAESFVYRGEAGGCDARLHEETYENSSVLYSGSQLTPPG